MPFDPTLILLVVVLGAFIIFQVVQGRKRRRETEERVSKFTPGVEIMTNYGLYGTILSIDDDKNLAIIETSPGATLKIHRQTILKVADYDTPVAADDESAVDAADDVETDSDASSVRAVAVDSPADTDLTGTTDGRRADAEVDASSTAPRFTEPRLSEPRYGERIENSGIDASNTTPRSGDTRATDGKADD